MDTSAQTLQVRVPRARKRRRTVEERRGIVEETFLPGASVSRVARRHDVNANQVFHWRKLYRAGRLGGHPAAQLLPVEVAMEQVRETARAASRASRSGLPAPAGTMEIQFAKGTLRLAGAVDVVALRAVLECLAR